MPVNIQNCLFSKLCTQLSQSVGSKLSRYASKQAVHDDPRPKKIVHIHERISKTILFCAGPLMIQLMAMAEEKALLSWCSAQTPL